MKGSDAAIAGKPAWLLAAGVTLVLTVGMCYLRLSIYPQQILPLAYALPLLVALWHRDRVLLWAMAACFMVVAVVKVVWLVPDEFFDDGLQYGLFTTMHLFNVIVPAGAVHLALNYRRRLLRSNEALAATNEELESGNEELLASNEELAAREEEITRQHEELQSQAEELEQQAEELRLQTEELQTLNEELTGRETTLQMLLDLSGPVTSEAEVLHQICEAAPKLLGGDVSAVAILERSNGHLVVRSHSEFGPGGPATELPADSTVAAMALERMQAAQLEDTGLRPDSAFPPLRSGDVPRSILSVPLSLAHGPAGALEAYASRPGRWTDQQVQLLQWLAGQCSRAWESVRLRDELGRQHEQLQTMADAIPQLAWMAEPDGYLSWYNRRWYEYTGTTPEQMEGWGWQSVHDPQVLPEVLQQWKASIASGQPFDMTFPLRGADGVLRPFLTRGMPLKDDQGRILRWFGTNTDVSEQKRHESQIAKLTRLYAVLSQANEAIVRAHDAASLYAEVCRIVAATGGFPLVWIGEVSGPQVVPLASSGPAVDYLQEIRVEVQGELGVGPSGTCIRENHAVVNDDFVESQATSPWREPALRHGFRASAAFPLRRQGKAIGTITLYACEPHAFDAEQLSLLESLSADLSYALDAIDREQLRVSAEQALRKSEERLRLHVENTPLAVIEWGPDFRLSRWSTEAERIFGWRADEVCGKRMDEFRWVHDDDAAKVAQVSAGLLDGTCPRSVSHNRNYRKDGSIVHSEWYNSSLRDESGKLRSILSLVLDMTERERIEERTQLLSQVTAELLASDHPQRIVDSLCRRVMDHLSCQVFFNFLADDENRQLRLNACAGIPEEAARRIETLDFGAAVCGCAARDGCRIVAEDIQTSPDPRVDLARSFGVQAYACHPLMVQGKSIGTLSFGSRVKPAFTEDELDLMKVVADHVAIAMQRIRLMESLERHAEAAEAANQAKSQFLTNMSHELRTPMNAILGMIDVALPKAVDPLVHDCLQTAKGSADLLLTLLNDLLDSAKIESGKLELESTPFSLRRMLDQITRVLAARASEKGLAFYCRVPDAAPDAVVGDRMRLQQILLNLAGNAIKFTERGDVEIRLLASSEDDHASLEFAVRDTGIGIPPSGHERLFQPFAQADASMARRFGGTGLGLSISKSLVEMMGGRIRVESELGKGSTFFVTIRLPLAKEPPADFEAPVPISTAACAPLRILLVEDNPANQKLATYVLQDRGHRVEIARDGQEALKLTGQNRYDVVLMDVQMPGMNGLEATAAIRHRERGGSRVPIIAMTAHAMRGDRDRCLAAGMDGYLSKPIRALEMIGLIESLAHGAASQAQLAAATPGPAATPQAAAVFNPDEALSRCLNSQDMVREMIQCYFQEVDNLFPRMRVALEAGDLAAVGRLGHRMKGTLIYLGAQPAEEAARRVERFSHSSGTPSEAEEAVNALQRECLTLKSALTEHPLAADPA